MANTGYKIVAVDSSGEVQFSAEVLGASYGRVYHARQDAEDVAEDLQGDTEEYGLVLSSP